LKAKNVAQKTEDSAQQNRVIAAATQCALSTSQLVACTRVRTHTHTHTYIHTHIHTHTNTHTYTHTHTHTHTDTHTHTHTHTHTYKHTHTHKHSSSQVDSRIPSPTHMIIRRPYMYCTASLHTLHLCYLAH